MWRAYLRRSQFIFHSILTLNTTKLRFTEFSEHLLFENCAQEGTKTSTEGKETQAQPT